MKNYQEVGAFVLRVVLGITFLMHGLAKVQGGLSNIAGWFQSIGLPGFMAYTVGTIELVGGIALILGLGTRIVSALLIAILLVAIIKVKLAAGFLGNGKGAGYELELSLLVISLYLALNGSSFLSLDSRLPFSKANQAAKA